MPRWQVAYLAGCMALAGGALAYLLCDFGGWPMLMYDPYKHEWLVASKPPAPTVLIYPGMMLWGFCGAMTSAALSVVAGQRRRTPLSDGALLLAGAWGITAVLIAALYFLWGLWPF